MLARARRLDLGMGGAILLEALTLLGGGVLVAVVGGRHVQGSARVLLTLAYAFGAVVTMIGYLVVCAIAFNR